MSSGEGGDHASVALVGDDAESAAFGNAKIDAADANIRIEKDFSEGLSGDFCEGGDVGGIGDAQFFVEKLGNIFAAQMYGRGDDMTRFFVAKLDDIFAKIGFYDFVTGFFESFV